MEIQQETDLLSQANEAVQSLINRIPNELKQPSIGIICGSGLGCLAEAVLPDLRAEVPYSAIPYFPTNTVQGHAGKLIFGFLGTSKCPVALMMGRSHFYEGYSIRDITFPVRVLKLLGIHTLIVTNAAGGLNPEYSAGDIVVLNDHLNLAGLAGIHPLRGPNVEFFGTRFPPLSDAYDLNLRVQAFQAWEDLDKTDKSRKLHEGIYAFVSGPSYETRAECRMLRNLGADLVGMSTVPEIIVARHSNIRVLALSLVTNKAVLDVAPKGSEAYYHQLNSESLMELTGKGKADHEEVLQVGHQAGSDMKVHMTLLS